jgi:formate hydrogenlyase transcriptional activator
MSQPVENAESHELSDALEKLGQKAARLQTVIDTVPSFLWTSFPDGSKEYLNKRWYGYTGLTQEQGKGWGWKVVVHPDDLDRLLREWLALVDARKPGELETRIRRYDGEYRWFLIRVVPQLDAGGNVVRWFGSNTDIEDRKRAETKLLEDERELRRITDAIPHSVVVLDSEGHALYANQAMLDDTGLTMQEVLTSDFRARIFHPEDLQRVREDKEGGLAGGVPFEIKQRVLRKDGQYHWLLLRYKPFHDEHGRLVRWYATGTDIDDRRRAEDRTKNENIALREDVDHSSIRGDCGFFTISAEGLKGRGQSCRNGLYRLDSWRDRHRERTHRQGHSQTIEKVEQSIHTRKLRRDSSSIDCFGTVRSRKRRVHGSSGAACGSI